MLSDFLDCRVALLLAMTILPLLNSGKINRTGHNWQFSG